MDTKQTKRIDTNNVHANGVQQTQQNEKSQSIIEIPSHEPHESIEIKWISDPTGGTQSCIEPRIPILNSVQLRHFHIDVVLHIPIHSLQ